MQPQGFGQPHLSLFMNRWPAVLAANLMALLLGLGLMVELGVLDLVGVAVASPRLQSAMITVNTTDDDLTNNGNCTLREAIQAANTNAARDACAAGNGADTIFLPSGTYTLTILGADEDANASGDLDATDTVGLTISGTGAASTYIYAVTLDRAIHAVVGPLILNDMSVQGGFVAGNGGGIFVGSDLTMNNVQVLTNTASGHGGGTWVSGNAIFTNTNFIGNSATTNRGGGAMISGAVTIWGGSFANNRAQSPGYYGTGGGLYVIGTASVTGTAFSGNKADTAAGAYFENTASVMNTTFINNIALLFGGGAYFKSAASVSGTTFISNTAGYSGGAYFENTASVTSTTFISNAATTGGGGGAYFAAFGPASVSGSTFMGNTANSGGGGAAFDSTTSVTGTTFISNTAVYGGGAWFNVTASVTGTTFVNNMAREMGGGAYLVGLWTNTEQFVNVLFAANSASRSGAAVYAVHFGDNDTLTILHTTIASPVANSGTAVVVEKGTTYITNTIVASYTLGLSRIDGTLSEDFNLFDGVATPYSGTIKSGGNSITGTTIFFDTTTYTLTASSAAVDTGTSAGVTSDYEGDERPQGSGYDMGYDEFPVVSISGLNATNNSPQAIGSAVAFTATLSTGTNVVYQWDFGDGNLGSGAMTVHTYAVVETYTASVTATNSAGGVSTITLVTITPALLYLPFIRR